MPIALSSAGMVVRRLDVRAADVVFVKGVIEASDGLACVFAEPRRGRCLPPGATRAPITAREAGASLILAAPPGRESDLAELVADLSVELSPPSRGERGDVGDRSKVSIAPSVDDLGRSNAT